MNVGIIGSGAAGLYLAIFLKKNNPYLEITVFEKEEKLAKKLYATGNGHCNLLNKKLLPNKYNHPEFMKSFLHNFDYETLKKELSSLGIALLENDNYVYPLSFHAGTYVQYLLSLAKSLDVEFKNITKISNYSKGKDGYLIDEYGHFDKLIIATGGASSPNLGSDGSFFEILKKHGYSIEPLRPGLTPLRVKEKVGVLQGIRHKALVKAFNDNKQVFAEEGEVLFKKDGISGIVIFNAESAIYRSQIIKNPRVSIDLFPDFSFYALCDVLSRAKQANPENYLSSVLVGPLAKYVLSISGNHEIENIANNLKRLSFSIDGPYGFVDSQVTIGGVSLNEITPFLESKKERGLYFAGEVLDVDGDCGGYNLSWALISALMISKHL